MSRYARELSEHDLGLVSAAGEPDPSCEVVNGIRPREDGHPQDKNG